MTAANTDLNSNFTAIDTGAAADSVKPSSIRTKGFEPIKNEESQSTQKTEKITSSNLDSAKRNVLKSQLEEKLSLLHKGPLGLGKPHSDAVPTISDINKALKKEPSIESPSKPGEVKGILKKEGSFETRKMEVDKSAIQNYSKVVESVVENEEQVGDGVESSGDNLDSDEGLLDSTEAGGGDTSDKPVKRSSKTKRRFNRDRKMEQER